MSVQKEAINGFKWNFLQQFSVQIINFTVQLILARILMPEMFGLIAMLMVFISIGQTLMDSGMTSSLIRTNNPTELDYSTVFWTNISVSLFVYILVYIGAPYVALFYEQKILEDLIRIFALVFIIKALIGVHIAKLTKELNFKLQMQLQIPSSLIAGGVGISLALQGYGVWSLVWLNLIQASVFTILILWLVKWKLSFVFSKDCFCFHFVFGYKLTLASLIDVIFNDLYRIIIGKFFSPQSVGYFNQAETMRLFPVQQISMVVEKVTYPLFSNLKNDEHLRYAYNITAKIMMFITVPIMFTLILIANEGFRLLFGEKWLPAVPYFQILAIASIVRPVSSYSLNILKVKGRSDIFLKIEILKKIIGLILIVVGFQFGILGLVFSLVFFSLISYFINIYFSGLIIGINFFTQLKKVIHFLIFGTVIFLSLYFLKNNDFLYLGSDIIYLIFYSIFFNIIYFSITLLYDGDILNILKKLAKI